MIKYLILNQVLVHNDQNKNEVRLFLKGGGGGTREYSCQVMEICEHDKALNTCLVFHKCGRKWDEGMDYIPTQARRKKARKTSPDILGIGEELSAITSSVLSTGLIVEEVTAYG